MQSDCHSRLRRSTRTCAARSGWAWKNRQRVKERWGSCLRPNGDLDESNTVGLAIWSWALRHARGVARRWKRRETRRRLRRSTGTVKTNVSANDWLLNGGRRALNAMSSNSSGRNRSDICRGGTKSSSLQYTYNMGLDGLDSDDREWCRSAH